MSNSSANTRNQRVDFLRGIAILSVLVLHYHLAWHLDQSALTKIFSSEFIQAIVRNGNYGVTIFFVISGFLITTTSLERYGSLGKIDARSFYILRFARIMPCLLLVLAFITIFNWLHIPIFQNTPNKTSFFLSIFSVLTFWHNVLMAKVGYFNYCLNIFWSLSVEEVFYLTFPLLCLLLRRTSLVVGCWIALIIIAPIYRSLHLDNHIIFLYSYFACFDAIAIGCVAAVLARKFQFKFMQDGFVGRSIRYGAWLLIIGVYCYAHITKNAVIGFSLIALSAAILLIGAKSEQRKDTTLAGKAVCWFGKNSYELYLFHIVVLALMKEVYDRNALGNYGKILWMVLYLGLTVLVSGIIAKFYSQPMNKKIRGIFL